jgi:hypothetical protein
MTPNDNKARYSMAIGVPLLAVPTLIVAATYSPIHALLFGVLTGLSWALAALVHLKNVYLAQLTAASTALMGVTTIAAGQGLLRALSRTGAYAVIIIQLVFTIITMAVGPFVVVRKEHRV